MAKSPFIFAGNYAKTLNPSGFLNLSDKLYQINGTVDPTVVAQDAPAGSLYSRTGLNPDLFLKMDAGLSTNWVSIGANTIDAIHEVPIGVVNGVNANFTISQAPISVASLIMFLDGTEVSPAGYSLAGTTVTFNPGFIPVVPQQVTAYYLINAGFSPASVAVTWESEAPVGAVNGVNVTFTVTGPVFDTKTFDLYLNGSYQYPGIDYTLAGTTITMTVAPVVTQTLWATYRKT